MNIFVVHEDPKVAARSLCDQHIVKMPLETSQIMNNCIMHIGHSGIMAPFNPKHPACIWAENGEENFFWLAAHGLELCSEFERRFGKIHGSLSKIKQAFRIYCEETIGIPIELTDRISAKPVSFRYIGPQEFKDDNSVVNSYRNFYNLDKSRFARWNRSKPPEWYKGVQR